MALIINPEKYKRESSNESYFNFRFVVYFVTRLDFMFTECHPKYRISTLQEQSKNLSKHNKSRRNSADSSISGKQGKTHAKHIPDPNSVIMLLLLFIIKPTSFFLLRYTTAWNPSS